MELTQNFKLEELPFIMHDIFSIDEAHKLVREIYRRALENPNLVGILRSSDHEKLVGLSYTLEYLILPKREREKFSFSVPYSGWGLFETLNHGIHTGENALWFSLVGGDCVLKGDGSGRMSNFSGKSKADGENSGSFSNFFDYAEASGPYSGLRANFFDYTKASGLRSGRKGIFRGNSEASGLCSGEEGIFFDCAYPTGINSGFNAKIFSKRVYNY